ncbi:YbaY family lipoprotein [Salinispirillum sp. LH 10-3-1]|uniref:YbaY family lipoprotein n=1 Tax=Salinispirillum sp. LH 10-3-1 TaxID=2952525 RepID=A0AB38YHA7_9GAMM
MKITWCLSMAVVGLLVGCSSNNEPAASAEGASNAVSAIQTVQGEAHFLERIGMPPDTYLVVQLIDLGLSDPGRALIAEHRLTDVGNPPYAFALDYQAERLQDEREYGLQLSLFGPDDRLQFRTPAAIPLGAEQNVLNDIRLVRAVDAQPRDDVATTRRQQAYQCGDLRIEVDHAGADRLLLTLPDRDLVLRPAISASGARFAADDHVFWSRGESAAQITIDGVVMSCDVTEGRSPWAEARERGVHFRAVGNEPGWLIEHLAGERAQLRLLLDYGVRELIDSDTQVDADQAGYRATFDGKTAVITLTKKTCTDTMSGQDFPMQAVLAFDGQTLTACGRFLHE